MILTSGQMQRAGLITGGNTLPAKSAVVYTETTYTSPQDGTQLDTYIRSATPTTNYAIASSLVIGERNDNTDDYHRGILLFDLPSVPTAIVSSATLSVWLNNVGTTRASENGTMYVHVITNIETSIQDCTWNVATEGDNWNTAGGDYDPTAIGSANFATTDAASTRYDFTLDNTAIQGLLRGTTYNAGFLLKMNPELNNGYIIRSAQAASFIATQRPMISITYQYIE